MTFEVHFKNGTMCSFESAHWVRTGLYGNHVYVFYSDLSIFNDQDVITDSTDTAKFDAVINQTDVIAIIQSAKTTPQ